MEWKGREIKFRFWDEEHEEWIIFTLNELVERRVTEANNLSSVLLKFLKTEKYQYTGLKDEGGVEIYGGDVITYQYYKDYGQTGEWKDTGPEIVKWRSVSGFTPFHCWSTWEHAGDHKHLKVIGNIFENPELLEGE